MDNQKIHFCSTFIRFCMGRINLMETIVRVEEYLPMLVSILCKMIVDDEGLKKRREVCKKDIGMEKQGHIKR